MKKSIPTSLWYSNLNPFYVEYLFSLSTVHPICHRILSHHTYSSAHSKVKYDQSTYSISCRICAPAPFSRLQNTSDACIGRVTSSATRIWHPSPMTYTWHRRLRLRNLNRSRLDSRHENFPHLELEEEQSEKIRNFRLDNNGLLTHDNRVPR